MLRWCKPPEMLVRIGVISPARGEGVGRGSAYFFSGGGTIYAGKYTGSAHFFKYIFRDVLTVMR